tara:strand:+ start:31189 stop:31506 length:318 start_codon:yes stop_codon:yes gene_type:complete
MGLREEIAADFSTTEVDEDLFEEIQLGAVKARAMVSDDPILSNPNDDGGGFIAEGDREFKFRRSDNLSVSRGGLVVYGGERYRIYSVVDRPGHPLILTRGRLEGA